MRYPRLHQPITIACIAMAAAAQAAPGTWRCGNTYTDQPCPEGKALRMDTAPSTERVRDADEHTRRMQAAAARMEAERIRRDRERPSMVHLPAPVATRATVDATPTAGRKNKARNAPDFFKAAGPGSAKTPKKKKAAKAQAAG